MGTIKGRVTSPDGASIEGASIMIVSGPVHHDLASETDRYGRYELGPVSPGTYQVSVAAEGFTSEVGAIPVRSGRVTRADITLQYDQVMEIGAADGQAMSSSDGLGTDFAGFTTSDAQQARRRRSRNVQT